MQSQENCARSHDHETMTFRNSGRNLNHLLWLHYYLPAKTSVTCSVCTTNFQQKPQSLSLIALLASGRNLSHLLWLHSYHPAKTSVTFSGCTTIIRHKSPSLVLAALLLCSRKSILFQIGSFLAFLT